MKTDEEKLREALAQNETLGLVVNWQRRRQAKLVEALEAAGVPVPPEGTGPVEQRQLDEVYRAMASRPDAIRVGSGVDAMAGVLEKWQHDHEARTVNAVRDFDREWRITELEARLAAAGNPPDPLASRSTLELGLALYRAKRMCDGGGVKGDPELPARVWNAVRHYYADRAIARCEAGHLKQGRLDDAVDAHVEAVRRWGAKANVFEAETMGCMVGMNDVYDAPAWIGVGKTWAEAFAMAEEAIAKNSAKG